MTDIESLSEEWSDDERMGVMFGKLRNKELNQASWESKISVNWKSLSREMEDLRNV